jgi:hypothetical protein
MDRKRSGLTAAVDGPRAWMASAALLMGLAACMFYSPARAADTPQLSEAQLAAARAASKDLGETLKAQLVAAIKAGGPQSAVGVCRTIGPAIAGQASQAHGLEVGRTALRVRNPANAPDDFERRALEDFVQKIVAGADPAKLEHAEIVAENGETTFRYMKAIPTAAEPCLACHGANVEPALKAEILRLYPDDQATGFKTGELRGAFTVKQKMR